MIGRLTGKLVHKQPPQLLLDVSGVCYEIDAPMTTFYDLPELGATLTLHTHLLVREDAQLLYGFLQYTDRAIFRTLIKINGVGAKLALALMSNMAGAEMVLALETEDVDRFIQVPGVGKKTAARLMVELKDKFDALQLTSTDSAATAISAASADDLATGFAQHDPVRDAVSALMSLGYKPPEASRMVSRIKTQGLASDEIIKQALRLLTTTA